MNNRDSRRNEGRNDDREGFREEERYGGWQGRGQDPRFQMQNRDQDDRFRGRDIDDGRSDDVQRGYGRQFGPSENYSQGYGYGQNIPIQHGQFGQGIQGQSRYGQGLQGQSPYGQEFGIPQGRGFQNTQQFGRDDRRNVDRDEQQNKGQREDLVNLHTLPRHLLSTIGPHVGKGPKGYKRSDERIREEVCDRLADHPLIDASEIDVRVQSGEVTLTGVIHERSLKWLVEQVVDTVAGVQDVTNNLRVQRQTSGTNIGTNTGTDRTSQRGTEARATS